MKADTDEMSFLQDMARAIDNCLTSLFGRKLGFALLVFELDDSNIGNYVSNVDRDSMVKALRDAADRLESRQVIPKTIGPVQ